MASPSRRPCRVTLTFDSWTDGEKQRTTLTNTLDRWEVHCASEVQVTYEVHDAPSGAPSGAPLGASQPLCVSVVQKPRALSPDKIGVGACLWDGAIILGAYLACQPRHTYIGCGAVELGAGVGMLSCLLCRLGARKVYSSDLQKVLALLQENADVNACGDVMEVMELEWGTHTDHLRKADDINESFAALRGAPYPDLVIASDVTYHDNETSIQPDTIEFVKLCRRLCGPDTKVLIGLERRSSVVRDMFIAEVKARFGRVRMIDLKKEKLFPKELLVDHIDLWELHA
jgi:predicted nicotinamide N-methyase